MRKSPITIVFQRRVFSVLDSILSLQARKQYMWGYITRGFMKTPGFRPSQAFILQFCFLAKLHSPFLLSSLLPYLLHSRYSDTILNCKMMQRCLRQITTIIITQRITPFNYLSYSNSRCRHEAFYHCHAICIGTARLLTY